VIVIALGATFGLHRLIDPDLFQHVAVGRAILAHPSSLGVSTFHDAFPDYPYVEDKWLPSIVAALVDAIGGASGLMIYQIAICVAVALAWYGMQRVWGATRAAAVLGVTLGLLACTFRLEPRPDTISHALLAATIALVAMPGPRRRILWLTAGLFVLWINVHGYFVNGLLVLVAAAVARGLGDRTLGVEGMPSASDRAVALAVAVAACLIHPQGVWALLSPVLQLDLMRSAAFHAGIQELEPVARLFGGATGPQWIVLTAPFAIAACAAFVVQSAAVRQAAGLVAVLPWLVWPPAAMADALPYRVTLALWMLASIELPRAIAERRFFAPLLLAGFTVLAVPAVRNLPLLVPAALLLLAPVWSAIEDRLPARHAARGMALAGLVTLAVAVAWFRLSDRMNGDTIRGPTRTGWGVDADRFPVGAAEFIARDHPAGTLLNGFDIGGYLVYRLHPQRRVFIAGNASMYPIAFFEEYVTQVTGPAPSLDELTERYGIQTVVWDLASPAANNLFATLAASPQWKIVFLDSAAVVFTRAPTIAAIDLRRRVPELVARDLSAPALPVWLGGKPLTYPALNLPAFLQTIGRPDLALVAAEPLWPRAPSEALAALIGTAAIQTNALTGRLDWLEVASQRYPRSTDLQTLLFHGLASDANRLLAMRDADQAERRLRRMVTLQPGACGPYLGLAKAALLKRNEREARAHLADAMRHDGDGACRRGVQADPELAALH
jgi:hypothetical protein